MVRIEHICSAEGVMSESVSSDQNPAYIFVVDRGLLYNSYIWIRMSHYKDHYELISTVSW